MKNNSKSSTEPLRRTLTIRWLGSLLTKDADGNDVHAGSVIMTTDRAGASVYAQVLRLRNPADFTKEGQMLECQTYTKKNDFFVKSGVVLLPLKSANMAVVTSFPDEPGIAELISAFEAWHN